MISKSFVISVLILVTLSVYLFASAPARLPEQRPVGETIPIAQVFNIVEAENDVVRALWTKEIVGSGKQAGLTFDEDWREEHVQAGPLPALFLRETAVSLEKNPVRLSLYLGSDYPIKPANKFTAAQMEKFQGIRKTGEPQFFFEQDTGLHTAMFSDIAVVEACIDCHNKHKETPKSDWKLGDVMGATTWSYPEAVVTLDELMKILTALRQGFREAYTAYLAEVESFARRPQIGDKWPREGFYLPTVDVFMGEALKRASSGTLASVLTAFQPKEVVAANNTPSQPKAVSAVATPISTKPPAVTDPQANAAYETPAPQSDVIQAAGSSAKTQRVAALLSQAERQIAAKRLTTPVGDAAFESYEDVLKLIPGHGGALEGIGRIKDEYKRWAETDKRRGNWKRAEANLEKALAIDPEDAMLPVALRALREAQKRAEKEAAPKVREQGPHRLARQESFWKSPPAGSSHDLVFPYQFANKIIFSKDFMGHPKAKRRTQVNVRVLTTPNQAGGEIIITEQECPNDPQGNFVVSTAVNQTIIYTGCAVRLDQDRFDIQWNNGTGSAHSMTEFVPSEAVFEQGLRALPSHEGSRSSPGDVRSKDPMAPPVTRFEEFERRMGIR